MEKVLSTLGIHELRGYGRLVSAIGVAPEVLDILAIPGFCASEGRGPRTWPTSTRWPSRAARSAPGEESPSKVKLPRMYPKVWKALARVANSERGYEEFAETHRRASRPSSRWRCATPCSRSSRPEDQRIPADGGQLPRRRAHACPSSSAR